MIKNIKIVGCLFFLVTLLSCVKDGVEECPEETVKLHFFVEKFRNRSLNPLDDVETEFCSIVKHLQYYLYKDGQLVQQSAVSSFDDGVADCYSLTFTNLEPGDYDIVVVSNCTKDALNGDPVSPSSLVVVYPGCGNSEDYFSAVDSFTVRPEESQERNIGLLRMHGVVRFTFENIPEDVIAFEVLMDNVSNEKWIMGDYKNVHRAIQRYSLIVPDTRQEDSTEEYIIGTFPTVQDGRSSYSINLYRDGNEEPYITHLVSDDLVVERNQLLDITTSFDDAGVSFEINLDSKWNGSNSGGQTGIE